MNPPSSWKAIYHGQQCVGHIIHRGPLGVESFDREDASLGLFPTEADAINALDRVEPKS
jgi:hypothetical protein